MSGFTDYLPEVFAEFGAITLRRMFGGHGVYHQGLMFALVADDTLYLKADAENRIFFERENLPAFEYVADDRTVRMSYHRAPDDIFDDRESAALWAQRSFAAAQRAQATKKKRATRSPRKRK